MLIGLEKRHCLRSPHIIKIGVNSAALYYAPTVIIRLTMTN